MELRHLAIARLATLVIVSLVIALSPGWLPSAWALSIGQQDNFEDGTTQGWVVALGGAAHPRPPVNIPSGGPTGAGDNFLFLTALGGQGPGSRLTVINVSQWTGDFIAAGISGVRMDLINLGPTDLNLRLLFSDESARPPQNLAFSTTPFFLPAGAGWTSAFFSIAPGNLTAGAGSVTAALHDTTEFRIFNSTATDFPGEPIVASLGVDNITATPEPASAALLGSTLLALYTFTRTRRTTHGRQ
jgi:hypothetical protein